MGASGLIGVGGPSRRHPRQADGHRSLVYPGGVAVQFTFRPPRLLFGVALRGGDVDSARAWSASVGLVVT